MHRIIPALLLLTSCTHGTPKAPAEPSGEQVAPAQPGDHETPAPAANEEPTAGQEQVAANEPAAEESEPAVEASPQPPQSPGPYFPPSTPQSPPPPKPSPEECARCMYIRVLYGKEADFDEALLCAHEPARPMKPHNMRGAKLRHKIEKCDPACCFYYSK